MGDSVRSDIVDVKYALTITEQPQNANLNGKDSVVLTVRAQGKGGSI